MALVMNEMLQDPAVVMTSKNPSLSAGPKARPRFRAGTGTDLIANLISPSTARQVVQITETATGRPNKSAKRTPKKRKPKSPSKQVQTATTEPVALLSSSTIAPLQTAQENENQGRPSPSKKSRRDSRTFRPSNKNFSPRTPKQANIQQVSVPRPLANQTNLIQPVQQQQVQLQQPVPQPKLVPNTMSSFKRFINGPSNGFQQNRFVSSDLNPFARSFVPRYAPKPGVSNEYVSREIFEYYQRNRQTNEGFKSKQILRQSLENTLKHAFPNYAISLHLVGSSTNGIGDNSSSADICITAHKRSGSISVVPVVAQPEEVLSISKDSASVSDSVVESTTATATVPVVTDTENSEAAKEVKSQPEQTTSAEIALPKANNQEAKPEVTVESVDGVKEKNPVLESTDKPNDAKHIANQVEQVETLPSELSAHTEVVDLTLESIVDVLKHKNFAKNITSVPAMGPFRVPIIRFKDDISKLDITLNLNSEVSIRNTQLIRDYAKMDWRFAYLAMIMKQWARENRINSAKDHTVSNYSWTLMVIHYLQVCEPPVLPCLQKLVSRRYDQHNSIDQAMSNWRRYPAKWRSNNNSNLRQLLKGLFRYYGYTFKYDQHVISVREGRALDRSSVYTANPEDRHNPWNSFLCVEEPFNRSNTTRSLNDKDKFDRMIELLRMSYNALRGVRISLFNVIADDLDFPITY